MSAVVINVDTSLTNVPTIEVGKQGENGATQVVFDVSEMIETYGSGTAYVVVQRRGDAEPYLLDNTSQSGDKVTWTVSNVDTDVYGTGRVQLFWLINEQVAKTVTYQFYVEEALHDPQDAPVVPGGWISDEIGNLDNLTTTAKANLVAAINEVNSKATTNATAIGTLANLTTTEKSNLVGAINEVDADVSDLKEDLSDAKEDIEEYIGFEVNATLLQYAWNGNVNPYYFAPEAGYKTACFLAQAGKTYSIKTTGTHNRFGVYTYPAWIDLSNPINPIPFYNQLVQDNTLNEYIFTADGNVLVGVYLGISDGSIKVTSDDEGISDKIDSIKKEIGVDVITTFTPIRGYILNDGTINTASAVGVRTAPISISVGDSVSFTAAQYSDTCAIAYSEDGNSWTKIQSGKGTDVQEYSWISDKTGFISIGYLSSKPFDLKIVKKSNVEGIIERIEKLESKDNTLFLGSPQTILTQPTATEYVSLNAKTIDELYAVYDDLVANYPEFITRGDDLGTTVSGDSIRQYTISCNRPMVVTGEVTLSGVIDPSVPNEWNNRNSNKVILINTGCHGNEKAPTWGTALAVKELLESEDQWARYIKDNFVIKILPCMNPYGFHHYERMNENGVNLNRDCVDFTQPETRAWKKFIDENKDNTVFYLDAHGTSGYYAYYEIVTGSQHVTEYLNGYIKMLNLVEANWRSYWNMPSAVEQTFLVVKSTHTGLSMNYTESNGLPSITLETPQNPMRQDLGLWNNTLQACKITKDLIFNTIALLSTVFN